MPVQRSSNVFQVKVDGTPLRKEIANVLIEAFVEDELNLPDVFELVFSDPLRTVLGSGGFEIGKKLAIAVASEASPEGTLIVDGQITAVEAEIEPDRTVTIVRGYDASHRLQHGTVTETHLDVTYGDIVGKIAQRRGLQQGESGSNTVVHEAVVQWNQTDWEFVSQLAAEIGHEVVVADGQLHLREPTDSTSGPSSGDLRAATARQLVVGGNVLRLRATVSGAEQVDEVQVRGWDYREKQAVEATAKTADGSRSAAAGTGSADLAGKLGGGTLVKVDLPVDSAETAQHAADSLVEQLGSAAVELDAVVHGNPDLRAGVSISLTGAGAPFDGQYVLTSVRHTYEPGNGYLTRAPRQRAPDPDDARARHRRPRRRRPQRGERRGAGDRQQPRRSRRARSDEGHLPVAGRQLGVALGPGVDAGRGQRARLRDAARGRRRGARRLRPRRPPAAVRRRRPLQRQGQAARQPHRQRRRGQPRDGQSQRPPPRAARRRRCRSRSAPATASTRW